MNIGVSSYSFKKLLNSGKNYFEICDQASEMGYDGIEFIDLSLQHGTGQTTVEALAEELRAHCEEKGLKIVAYTVAADFLCGRDVPAADEPVRVKKCVDIACLLGAKILRHDAFWKVQGVRSWQEAVQRVAPGIREVAEYAAQKGVRTCTENHGLVMQDSARVEQLILEVNHPNYGWLVDIGNFLCADEEPRHAVGVAAPYAVHAHVKDFIFKSGTEDMPEGSWITTRGGNYIRGTVVGHGVVPVRPCVNILKRSNYQGYLSVEFEGAEEPLEALKQALAYLRRVTA